MADKPIKPVYILHGDDTFMRDEHRRRIICEVVADADPQTCVSVFDAAAELAEVLDELRTMPFLAPRRVVMVRDADAFVSAYRDSLEKYLARPSSTGALVLMVSSWPRNTRLYKLVSKVGVVLDCSAPEQKDLPGWIVRAAAKRGKKIDPDAADLIAECIGSDRGAIDSEIDKLSIYVGHRERITADDVGELVAASAGPAAFALAGALTEGNAAAALKALAGMLTVRGEEFRTLGMIAWHLRRTLHAQRLIRSGQPPQDALRAVRVFYNKPSFLALLKRRPMKKLQADFRKLIGADLAMKSGTPAAASLQQLVLALCS